MARSYFPRAEFQKLGFSEPAIRVLEKIAGFADLVTQTDGINEDLTDVVLLAITTEIRVDALEAAGPYVEQDVGPAWAAATGTAARSTFATFTGQMITNPPTQVEVQAIDDHVVILSQRLKALVDDLKGNGALT